MLIVGHSEIAHQKFVRVESLEQIAQSRNDEVVWFPYNGDFNLLKHCASNEVAFGVLVESVSDFVLSASFMPHYLIVRHSAQTFQQVAQNYLFDSKVLYVIKSEDEIESLAKLGIDGVIFADALRL